MLERADLIDFIASGERTANQWTVGTEYEKHVVDAHGRPLPYASDEGGPSIRGLLQMLVDHRGWNPVNEGEHLVALQKNGASISLEPGGQIELSGAPFAALSSTKEELAQHVEDLTFLTSELGLRWLWSGLHPLAELDAISWMPKKRYVIMRRYLPTKGTLAHYMMKSTATVQANLDFGDEGDMGHKLRTSMALSSLVAALFANSPAGVPALGHVPSAGVARSWRWHVWKDTDPDRCGLLPWVFEGDSPTYEQWVDYALDVPMFLLEKQGQIVDMAGRSFRTYAAQGFDGHQPILEDWALHLSTLFPDVRLKTYLEMRSADCVPPHLISALPALWKGLLYDGTALDAAWDLVKGWSFHERLEHRDNSCGHGLAAEVPGKSYRTQALAVELVAIARAGLPPEERPMLDELEVIASSGRTLADQTLDWLKAGNRTPADVLEYYEQQ